MLPKDIKPTPATMNFIFMQGGVGDHVGSLVPMKYIADNYPWIKILLWVPDYFLEFAKHSLRDYPKMGIFNYSAMKDWYNHKLPTKTTKWDQVISPMKIHTVDYAFLKLCDELPREEDRKFLQVDTNLIKQDLPNEPYVVITTGFTAEVREWPASEVNKVIDYLRFHGIAPLFLGQTRTQTGSKHIIEGTFKDEIHYEKGINLIDRTTLLQAAKIMSGAKAVLGVDNGLLHIAATTRAPIIAGFTTVTPMIRRPYGIEEQSRWHCITPDLSLECRFCQQNTNFILGHDYRNCLYKGKNQKKTNVCTTQMTAEKFIKTLSNIL